MNSDDYRDWRTWFPWPIGSHWCWFERINLAIVIAYIAAVLTAVVWTWMTR